MWVCIHQSIHSVGLVECYGCFLCNMLSHVCRSSTHSQEDPVLRRIEACTIYISYQCYDLLHTSDLTKYHGTIVLPTRGICRLSIWVVNRPFLYLTMLWIQTRCYVMYMVTKLIILIRFLVHFAYLPRYYDIMFWWPHNTTKSNILLIKFTWKWHF